MLIKPIPHRNALNDLVAEGEALGAVPVKCPRPVSRSRPPRIFGVLAQNAQMYTRGRVLRLILIHFPWSHISQDSLYHKLVGTHCTYRRQQLIAAIAGAGNSLPLNHEPVSPVSPLSATDTPDIWSVC